MIVKRESIYVIINVKGGIKIPKEWMAGIFLREDSLVGGNSPVYVEGFIFDRDTSISFGVIEIVALVLKYSCFGQDGKAMGKSFWYEKLQVVVLCQFHGNVLPVCGGAFAYVDCYVKDSSPDTAHEFALGIGRALEMQTSHDAIYRHTLVVLHKVDVPDLGFKISLRK